MFFNIQRWSLHDGPGIRTTVFFQGCPLRCCWCSNPESWEFKKQEKSPTIEDILETIERDAVFYRASGGGVTFSGGEPFAQPELLRQLADSLNSAGIKAAIETSGYFNFRDVSDILDMMDDIFIDIKHTNDAFHRKLTGVSNKRIIKNIFHINESGRKFVIRIPLVKGITDTPGNIDEIIRIGSDLENLIRIEVLPYHPLGVGKYKDLNQPYDETMSAPEPEMIESILNNLQAHGLKAECSSARYTFT